MERSPPMLLALLFVPNAFTSNSVYFRVTAVVDTFCCYGGGGGGFTL